MMKVLKTPYPLTWHSAHIPAWKEGLGNERNFESSVDCLGTPTEAAYAFSLTHFIIPLPTLNLSF